MWSDGRSIRRKPFACSEALSSGHGATGSVSPPPEIPRAGRDGAIQYCRSFPCALLSEMQRMRHSMQNRSQEKSRNSKKHDSCIKSKKAGEHFSFGPFQIANRSHAAEQHRSIQECIKPLLGRENVESYRAGCKRKQ